MIFPNNDTANNAPRYHLVWVNVDRERKQAMTMEFESRVSQQVTNQPIYSVCATKSLKTLSSFSVGQGMTSHHNSILGTYYDIG